MSESRGAIREYSSRGCVYADIADLTAAPLQIERDTRLALFRNERIGSAEGTFFFPRRREEPSRD